MSQETILAELLEENESLRKKVAQLEEQLNEIYSYFELEKQDEGVVISGVLIAEGVWKGVKYSYEEMCKALEDFKRIPILVGHGNTEEFGDRPVGEMLEVKKDDLLRALVFKAKITDPKAQEYVLNRILNAISIKGSFEQLDDSKVPPLGIGFKPLEASLTSHPACDVCRVFQIEDNSNNLCNTLQCREEVELSEETIDIGEKDFLVISVTDTELEEGSEIEAQVLPFEEVSKLQNPAVVAKVKPGTYPRKLLKFVKIYGYYAPLYPHYGYYYYYPYYGFYGYPYYYYKYPAPTEGEEVEQEETPELELAKIVCPVCGKEFDSKKKFLEHWKEKHQAKYGEYGQVKKLVKDIFSKEELRKAFKKFFMLEANTGGESISTQETQSATTEQTTASPSTSQSTQTPETTPQSTPQEPSSTMTSTGSTDTSQPSTTTVEVQPDTTVAPQTQPTTPPSTTETPQAQTTTPPDSTEAPQTQAAPPTETVEKPKQEEPKHSIEQIIKEYSGDPKKAAEIVLKALQRFA